MKYYIIFGRVPNTTGWEYIGEGKAGSPEEAYETMLDIRVREVYDEFRFVTAISNAEGDPDVVHDSDLVL